MSLDLESKKVNLTEMELKGNFQIVGKKRRDVTRGNVDLGFQVSVVLEE